MRSPPSIGFWVPELRINADAAMVPLSEYLLDDSAGGILGGILWQHDGDDPPIGVLHTPYGYVMDDGIFSADAIALRTEEEIDDTLVGVAGLLARFPTTLVVPYVGCPHRVDTDRSTPAVDAELWWRNFLHHPRLIPGTDGSNNAHPQTKAGRLNDALRLAGGPPGGGGRLLMEAWPLLRVPTFAQSGVDLLRAGERLSWHRNPNIDWLCDIHTWNNTIRPIIAAGGDGLHALPTEVRGKIALIVDWHGLDIVTAEDYELPIEAFSLGYSLVISPPVASGNPERMTAQEIIDAAGGPPDPDPEGPDNAPWGDGSSA